MATQRIKWFPATTPNIVAYAIISSDTGIDGPYTTLTQVLHQIPGPNFDDEGGFFFYDDTEVTYRYYRLRTLDAFGNIAEDEAPTPFQAGNDPIEAPSLHFIALDQDSGGQNNLQYVTNGGSPIAGATVRVYTKLNFDTNNLTAAIGTTITTATGGWATPVFVEPGETYTIVYSKVHEYGPDTAEITV
jgi:hypothetical protein